MNNQEMYEWLLHHDGEKVHVETSSGCAGRSSSTHHVSVWGTLSVDSEDLFHVGTDFNADRAYSSGTVSFRIPSIISIDIVGYAIPRILLI